MILEKIENICLILGNEQINKMSYSDQLKCLFRGLNYFCRDRNMLLNMRVYIFSLFHKQIKKKYPNLSKKEQLDMGEKLLNEDNVSTKTNENIKKQVLQEARKFFAKTLLKASREVNSRKDEMHISMSESKNENVFPKTNIFPIGIVIFLGIIFLLILFSVK